MGKKSFIMDEVEVALAVEFVKDHTELGVDALFEYVFRDNSGIGIQCIIRETIGGDEKDITNYDSW